MKSCHDMDSLQTSRLLAELCIAVCLPPSALDVLWTMPCAQELMPNSRVQNSELLLLVVGSFPPRTKHFCAQSQAIDQAANAGVTALLTLLQLNPGSYGFARSKKKQTATCRLGEDLTS